jgi:hypothetical protein
MRLLPWTNPLVATAFMLRARKSGLLMGPGLYVGLLAVLYLGWLQFANTYPERVKNINPNKFAFLFLFAGQCIFSGIIVLGQASSALKNEVLNKTLDFQRIAALHPWDILIGKLLGTSSGAYLLAIAALPVGVFSMLNGVPGVGLLEVILMWVQMLTFLFLLGACAIQNTLQISTPKGTGASAGFGFVMAMIALLSFSSFSARDVTSFLADPRRVTIPTLFTPVPAFAGALAENPWAPCFYWFSLKIPSLLFTPMMHVLFGWIALNIMVRRLQRLESTPLGKRLGYFFLAVADFIVVGAIASTGRSGPLGAAGFDTNLQLTLFFGCHVIVTLVYLVAVTPRKELIWAWVWRYRGRRSPPVDAVVEDRSFNTMPLIISLVFGSLGAMTLLLVSDTPVNYDMLLELGITVVSTILLWGLLYQAILFFSGKYGASVYFLAAFLFLCVPVIVGSILSNPGLRVYEPLGKLIMHTTPLSQPIKWLERSRDNPARDVSPYPVAIVYVALAAFVFVMQRRRLVAIVDKVERTKSAMGAGP